MKEQILRLLDLMQAAEVELGNLMSEGERQAIGELNAWAAKDNLCHTAGWCIRQVENIARARRGEPFIDYENYLEINDQDFLDCQSLSWEQSLESSENSRQTLRDLLDELSEEDLLRTDLLPSNRPLWQGLVFNFVEHALIHMGIVFNDLGKPGFSSELQASIRAELIALAPDDKKWKGTVIYNRACQHALQGQKVLAIAELKEALTLEPELTAWSKEDSDLISLHEEPGYQAIYSE